MITIILIIHVILAICIICAVLLQKSEAILFSDPAMDLTDDVTSMLDVAASEANTQSE